MAIDRDDLDGKADAGVTGPANLAQDPDSRSMATSRRGSGVVGYNVQVAVDTQCHLIVTHEATNVGSDRAQLANIASGAKEVLDVDELAELLQAILIRR